MKNLLNSMADYKQRVIDTMQTTDLSKIDIFSTDDNFKKYKNIKSNLRYGQRLKNIKLSIMIPVYKRTTYLQKAVTSALQQKTGYRYEVVVVDNTVESDAIYDIVRNIEDERLSYYKNEANIGMFGNWNRCIELAGADYLSILCDDDTLKENFVEEMLNKLVVLDNCTAITANYEFIDENNQIISRTDESGIFYEMKSLFRWYRAYQMVFIATIFSRKAALDIGGFNEELFPGSDVAFAIKLNHLKQRCYHYFVCFAQYRIASNESMNPVTQLKGIRFIKWFVNSLQKHLCLDGYYHELHRRELCLQEEKLRKEWFSSKEDTYTDINMELGISELNEYEKQYYKRYTDFYMQRIPVNSLNELAYVGDLMLVSKE